MPRRALRRPVRSGVMQAVGRRNRAAQGPSEPPISPPSQRGTPQVTAGVGRDTLIPLIPTRPNYQNMRREEGRTNIHVSDLLYKCARKIALAHRHEVRVVENPIFDSLSLTFRQGEAIHDHVRDVVAKEHPDQVYAIWKCRCGKSSYEGLLSVSQSRGECGTCGQIMDRHNERPVYNDEYNMVGSPDLLLYMQDAFYINEIKSMAARYWDDIARPVPEHMIQVLFYWWLMREEGKPLHDHVSILYVNKEYRPRNPYKEFTIKVADELHRLDDYIIEANAIKTAINGGPIPSRIICPTMNAPEAKKCELCSICFSMD